MKSLSHLVNWSTMLVSLSIGFVVRCLALAVGRLYFILIAYFPGSKLTACTGWYETYLDVFVRGQFTFQTAKSHQQYGKYC